MASANHNLIKMIRACLDRMKKEYGGEITVCRLNTASTDRADGTKAETHTATYIKRAIVLPAKVRREVIQSISAVSANKYLAYGGSFENGIRTFIIDRRDAPGIVLTNDDWVVYEGVRYDIKAVEEFEQSTAWVVTAKYVAGTPADDDLSLGEHNPSLIRLIRNAIDRMKKEYGGEIVLHKLGTATTNLATGVKTFTHTSTLINRAVVLPANVQREVIQSVAIMSVNKKMVMGGAFDTGTRVFIIDRRDAPGVTITTDDWITYEHVRYNLKEIEEFEQSTAWLVTGKSTPGAQANEDIRVYPYNTMALGDIVS